jgi:hypothetical protein
MAGATEKSDPVTSIEALGKLLGLMTGALLVLSVGYDYGYLSSIDVTFAAVPTTISDHIRTAIVWAPANGVGIAFGFLFGTIGDFQPPPANTRAGKQFRWPFVLAILVPISILFLMISTVFQALLIGALLLAWLGLIFRGSSALNAVFGRGVVGALFMVPPLLFSTTFAGSLQGPLLFSGSDRYSATIKVDSAMVELKDVGVRRFGSFALLGERGRKLHIVPDSAIVRVEKVSTESKPLSCRVWARLCPEQAASAPAPAAPFAALASAPPKAAASTISMPASAPRAAVPPESSAPVKP